MLKDRSLIKTITWRLVATVDTFLITWLISGSLTIGASVVSLEIITKMVLYYLHEKAWFKYDRQEEKETNIRG